MKGFKSLSKKLLVYLMALAMLVTIAPMTALADNASAANDPDTQVVLLQEQNDPPISLQEEEGDMGEWQEQTYTVTFHTGLSTDEAYVEDEYGNPSDTMTRTFTSGDWFYAEDDAPVVLDTDHYEFIGWSREPDAEYGDSFDVMTDEDVYAVWLKRIVVTYDAGNNSEGYVYNDGYELVRQCNGFFEKNNTFYERDTHSDNRLLHFAGWFDADGKQYTSDDILTEDLTVYAKWEEPKELVLDQEEHVAGDYEGIYFSFVPSKTAYYQFSTTDITTGTSDVRLYDNNVVNDYIYYASGNNSANGTVAFKYLLNAGQQYYYYVSGDYDYYDFNFKLSEYEVTALQTGQSYTAEAGSGGERVLYSFTPVEDGVYRIESHLNSYDNTPVVWFYDQNLNYLDSASYGASEYANFLLDTSLTAGTTYHFELGDDNYNAFSYPFDIHKVESVPVTFHINQDADKAWFGDDKASEITVNIAKGSYITYKSISELKTAENSRLFLSRWSADTNPEEWDEVIASDAMDVYALWNEQAYVDYDANEEEGGYIEEYWGWDDEKDEEVKKYSSATTYSQYVGNTFSSIEVYNHDHNKAFAGWYDAKEGGNKLDSSYIITGDMTVYAHWKDAAIIPLEIGKEISITDDDFGNYYKFEVPEDGNYKLTLTGPEDSYPYIKKYDADFSDSISHNSYEKAELTSYDLTKSDVYYFRFYNENESSPISGTVLLQKVNLADVTFHANNDKAYYEGIWNEETSAYTQVSEKTIRCEEGTEIQSDNGSMNFPNQEDESISFLGWSVNKDATVSDNEIILGTEDIEVYGVWKTMKAITLDANGGYFWDEENQKTITTYFDPEEDFYYRYTPEYPSGSKEFRGYATTKSATALDIANGDILAKDVPDTIYAVWKNRYRVTFDANYGAEGGEPLDYTWDENDNEIPIYTTTRIYLEGDTLSAPSVSSVDPFTAFAGWYTAKEGGAKVENGSAVTEELTLYAHWTTINETELEAAKPVTASSQTVNKVLYKFTPAEDGMYVFNSADGKNYYPTVTLYNSAKEKISVAYGSSSIGDNFLAFAELKAGKTYYYAIENEKTGAFSYPVKIEKVPAATVTFDANNSNAKLKNSNAKTMQIKSAVGYAIDLDDLVEFSSTPENMEFSGWSTDPEGKDSVEPYEVMITGDATLYAIWKQTATVTFHVNDPTGRASFYDYDEPEERETERTRTYAVGTNLWTAQADERTPEIDVRPADKAFFGWSVDPEAIVRDSELIVTGNMDVYAVWADYDSYEESDYTNAIEIKVGDTKTAESKGASVWYKFTPAEDGLYALASSDYDNDPVAEIYDSDGKELKYNDDGGTNWNFLIWYEMKAGETYYFRAYDRGAFKYQVTLTKEQAAHVTFDLNREDQRAWFSDEKNNPIYEPQQRTFLAGKEQYMEVDLAIANHLYFEGWSEDPNAEYGSMRLTLTDGMKLYAIWKDSVYVTFDINRPNLDDAWLVVPDEGARIASTTRTYRKGNNLSSGFWPNIANPDLSFLGWSVNKDATEPDNEILLDKDLTVYAVWGTKAYITFDANGGYYENKGIIYTQGYERPDSYLDNYSNNYHPVHADESLLFAGWSRTPNGQPIDEDTTKISALNGQILYAVWKKGVKVTLNANTAANPKGYFRDENEKEVTSVTFYALPGSTIDDIYRQATSDDLHKWDYGSRALTTNGEELPYDTVIESDTELFVLWTDRAKLTLDPGTGSINNSSKPYEYWWAVGAQPALSNFQAKAADEQKAFAGWSTDGTDAGIVKKLSLTKDTTLTAVYRTGATVTIAAPDKEMGYASLHVNGTWYDTDDDGTFSFIWPKDVPASELSLNGYAQKEGYIYIGLSTTADGKNLIDNNYTPTAKTTLYPVFKEGYMVYFQAHPGYFPSAEAIMYTDSASYLSVKVLKGDAIGTVEEPIAEGFTFTEWEQMGGNNGKRAAYKSTEIAKLVPTANMSFMALYEKADGHVHTAGEAVKENLVDATCEKAGQYDSVVYCTSCREELSRTVVEIPALGHDWDNGTITTPATCETAGVMTYTCKHDATHTYIEEIAATGHDWGEWSVTTPATENTEGVETRTCKNDPMHVETRAIPVIGHTHKTVAVAGKDATCTEAGVKAHYKCECGKLFSDAAATTEINAEDTIIPALGHDWGAPVWTWTADFTASAAFTCSRCKETKTIDASIIPEITKEATTTEDGLKTYIATVQFSEKSYTDTKTEKIGKKPSAEQKQSAQNTVRETEILLDGIEVATNASAVSSGKAYVSQADLDAFKTAIAAANAVIYNSNATAEEITQALADLDKAKAAFEAAKKTGSKPDTPEVQKTTITDADVTLSKTSVAFTGKAIKPTVTVKSGSTTLTAGTDYTVTYSAKTIKAVGTYKVTVTIIGDKYEGGPFTKTFSITKAAQPMKVKAAKVNVKASYKKVKSNKLTIASGIKFSKKWKGAVKYKKTKGNNNFTVNPKTGKITIKKGTKKGKYPIKIKVTAGNASYKSKSSTVTVTVTIK